MKNNINQKKVELLAPAGSYQAFIGAINAGADAVYLGGDRFSARAFADNFTSEMVCKAIKEAHLLKRKIYLTLNTLIKETEINEIVPYVNPMYEAGLDGVIIQDMGVIDLLKKHFPGLELHASTQMTLTGEYGAQYVKEKGICRVVPARELSLTEIKNIKDKTGLEIECFIHGAMCYCYSGQCLFSSILGGRSGNRGRCAQPCRLPYTVKVDKENFANSNKQNNDNSQSKDIYPLSLKDMCTLELLPELIEAGIDSFKIEGRMKRPEYAAGVTAIYRKYIDLYYKNGKAGYRVDVKDLEILKQLYLRTQLQTGYYNKHNGKEMVTITQPGYGDLNQTLLQDIETKYFHPFEKLKVNMNGYFKIGEEACITIYDTEKCITTYGEVVSEALNRPMDYEQIQKQLLKTGETPVQIDDLNIEMDSNLFIPVRSLNELRRNAIELFKKEYEPYPERLLNIANELDEEVYDSKFEEQKTRDNKLSDENKDITIAVSVKTKDQLEYLVQRLHSTKDQDKDYSQTNPIRIRRLYIDADLIVENLDDSNSFSNQFYNREFHNINNLLEDLYDIEVVLSMPFILRKRDEKYLLNLKNFLIQSNLIDGILVRNLEELNWVKLLQKNYIIIADAGLYHFNHNAVDFTKADLDEITLPYELNQKEIYRLLEKIDKESVRVNMIAYGRIPMMITANCIQKTMGECVGFSNKTNLVSLVDRYDTEFIADTNCKHCYNIIYNSVNYQIFAYVRKMGKAGISEFRLDFITEDANDMEKVLKYTRNILHGKENEFLNISSTTGHIKRGVD